MKLLNFPFIKFTTCLILGIVFQHYFNLSFQHITILLITLIGALSLNFIYSNYSYKATNTFGLLALLAFFVLGTFAYTINDHILDKSHYTHLNLNQGHPQNIRFKIKKRLKPDRYNDKYYVDVISINAIKTNGRLLLNIEKDSLKSVLDVGSVYQSNSKLTEVPSPLNPFQFDYSTYLKQRQVHHQIYTESSALFQISTASKSLYTYADQLRKTINRKLIASGLEGNTLSIINALLLGQRQDIDPDLYNNYVNAGTIHILAVSGLHVGIILLLLNLLLKPLHLIKYGRHYIKPIIIIIVLWSFAIVAGLSPSVTRAVIMFSIIAIAMHLKRQTNIYNTVAISAFFILLFQPIYVLDVGFQMSYLAVIAIVSIQPLLYKLWRPHYYITDKLWQIFTVTIAAQCGVAPISLYYFHQFPGLFFVSNLVIIPFLGIILGFGIFIIGLIFIDQLPRFIVHTFTFIIDSLNGFIVWVAQFENFLLRDIPFSWPHVLASYFFIISSIQLWKHKTFKSISYTLLSLILFSGVLLYTKYNTATSEFIIFNKNRHSILAERHHTQLTVYHNLDSLIYKQDKVLQNYKVGSFIDSTIEQSIENVYLFKGKTLLVIDSLNTYNVTSFQPNYILLRNSPKLNLDRLIGKIQPNEIIADASNYKSYVERWKSTCKAKKIPFHSTYEKGAYIIK